MTIQGTLTTALGALESGRTGFVQDASGGIALYLDAAVVDPLPAGTTIVVEGSVSSRFAQRTLRIAESSIVPGSVSDLPTAVAVGTGQATESFEGARVVTTGTVSGSPDTLADGLGITLDDGSGPVRAVIGVDALAGRTIVSGMTATVDGPLGQRDSSGTGTTGYRIQATLPGELELTEPTPSPTMTPTPEPTSTPAPTATPTPAPTATPTPAPTATPTPRPTPTPTTTPAPTPIPTVTPSPTPPPTTRSLADVRMLPVGTRVATSGVVIAEAGRLGTPPLLAIGDDEGALVVHLPDGAPAFARGTRIEVAGKLAAPYGQLEIRPGGAADIRATGSGPLPTPVSVPVGGLGESLESHLVTTTGLLSAKPTKSSSGDISLTLERDRASPVKVMADASSRITAASLKVGSTYRVVGVVGQRATRSGALDGYRIWARDVADLVVVTSAGPSPTASGTPVPSPSSGGTVSPETVPIARGLRITDRAIAIDAIVTAPATLLDATGRRIVVQDTSGAIEVLLPTGTTAPAVGARIHAVGRIGVAYGAPRLRADGLDVTGTGPIPAARGLQGPPGEADEWRLVAISGRIDSVHKLGDRWRAEVVVGGHNVVVVGQAGAGIASATLVEGRTATITGIARRPFPSATDRRFAVTPRFPADVRVAGAGPARPATGDAGSTRGGRPVTGSGPGASAATGDAGAASGAQDADFVDLASMVGRVVRVGGLVVDLRPDGFTLDDGSAVGRIVLRGSALDELPLVEPDDALNVVGRVEVGADGPLVAVDDPAGLVQAGDPVAAESSPSPAEASGAAITNPSAAASPGDRLAGQLAGLGGTLPLDPGAAGLGTLLAISAVSLGLTVLRREHARRRMAARIGRRLATFAGRPARPSETNAAERGPSTIHSA